MKVYIAGPMTGREFYGYEAFMSAAAGWRLRGHEVVTPFDANSIAWRRLYGRDFDPHQDKCDWDDPALGEMLVEDFAAMLRADAIAILPGWRFSKGTRGELVIALNVGKPVYCAITHKKLDLVAHTFFEGDVS